LPVRPILDEARANRVRQHVLDRALVVLVVPDHPRSEAGSEDVAVAIVTAIETLGVHAVQVQHPRREALGHRLDDEVVVRAHQAEGVALPVVALDDEGE
jgi:hypothetical protein